MEEQLVMPGVLGDTNEAEIELKALEIFRLHRGQSKEVALAGLQRSFILADRDKDDPNIILSIRPKRGINWKKVNTLQQHGKELWDACMARAVDGVTPLPEKVKRPRKPKVKEASAPVEAQSEPTPEVAAVVEVAVEVVEGVDTISEKQEKPSIGMLLSPGEQGNAILGMLMTLWDLVQNQTSHLETVTLQMEGRLTSRLDTQEKLVQELRNEQRLLSQGVWRAGKSITDLLRKLGQLSVNRKVRKAVDDFQPFDQEIDSGR